MARSYEMDMTGGPLFGKIAAFAFPLRIVWVATLFRWVPTQLCLYVSYPVSWTVTSAALLACLLVIRKKARGRAAAAA